MKNTLKIAYIMGNVNEPTMALTNKTNKKYRKLIGGDFFIEPFDSDNVDFFVISQLEGFSKEELVKTSYYTHQEVNNAERRRFLEYLDIEAGIFTIPVDIIRSLVQEEDFKSFQIKKPRGPQHFSNWENLIKIVAIEEDFTQVANGEYANILSNLSPMMWSKRNEEDTHSIFFELFRTDMPDDMRITDKEEHFQLIASIVDVFDKTNKPVQYEQYFNAKAGYYEIPLTLDKSNSIK